MYERILVADDDKDTCRMISFILEKEGYKVAKVYDGEQAIKKIKARGCNLMILDYKLPDMDGINVLKEIYQAKPSLEVIMISAYGSPSIKSMAKKLGVYRFLDKPFDIKRLVMVVRDALAKKSGTICQSTGREVDRSSNEENFPPVDCPTPLIPPLLRGELKGGSVESGLSPVFKSGIQKRKEV